MTDIKFLRVLGTRSRQPDREALVIAVVDDQLVRFSRRDGWTCDCATPGDECPHVDAAEDLLDDRVLGDAG
jgi:hypothetical protein